MIAIDGKTLRRSDDSSKNQNAIHMISAWASENNLVLGQLKVEDKSHEITAIPKLLSVLELNGCIVSIDAMGCQKQIAQMIIKKGGDYILSLKGNQGNLFEDVKQLCEWAFKNHDENIMGEKDETTEKNHGRIEKRRYWLINSVRDFVDSEKWLGLKSIGIVESQRKKNKRKNNIRKKVLSNEFGGRSENFCPGSKKSLGDREQITLVFRGSIL